MGGQTTLDQKQTALMYAAKHGHKHGVRRLIGHGADVHAHDTLRGHTALHHAARHGHSHVVECLCKEHGANIHHEDFHGMKAIHVAKHHKQHHVHEVLKSIHIEADGVVPEHVPL